MSFIPILKRIVFVVLLLSIFVSAHPYSFLKPVADRIWRPLNLLGLDVSMTPFTVDMMFMGSHDGVDFHDQNFRLYIFNIVETKIVEWKSLDFYEVKLPLLHHFEHLQGNADSRVFKFVLCQGLRKIEPEALGFFVSFSKKRSGDKNNSVFLGDKHFCLQEGGSQ